MKTQHEALLASRGGCWHLLQVKLYVYQMLRALAHIHSLGVCHRCAGALRPRGVHRRGRAACVSRAEGQ